jgi:hypothetical protein
MTIRDDPNIRIFRYEDFARDNRDFLKQLFGFPEVNMPEKAFDTLYNQHTFERLMRGRKQGQEDQHAHYRKGIVGDWSNYFDDKIMDHFRKVTGNTLDMLRY